MFSYNCSVTRYLLGFGGVIGDENIVEDGTRFNLPQVEASNADFVVFAERGVGRVVWVVDFRVDPDSL